MRTGSTSRLTIIGGLLSLAGLFIFVWMIQIQTSVYAKDLKDLSEAYTFIPKTIYPERGQLYDRWGHLLAGSNEVYELGANLREVSDPENIADTLSNLLGLDRAQIYGYLTMEQKDPDQALYMVLAQSVPPEKIAEIEELQRQLEEQREKVSDRRRDQIPSLAGLQWTPRLQRTYPEGSLAASVLGFFSFMDRDNGQGYFGVEQKYNHLLAGTPVTILVSPDPYKMGKQPEVPAGVSLVLTIDREIQQMVEEVLENAVDANGAASGTIVVMDPNNGEILAMASTPQLDLNDYSKYGEMFSDGTPYNRAVEQTYEPGSVFKVLTMAAALDSDTVEPDTPFLDTGQIIVGGVPIHNWDRGAWGPQTMTTCMQHSLNVCLSWIAKEMGPTTFYSYLQRFGIGHKTGIDLSGEVNYPLSVAGDPNWYEVNLATNSFGQGVSTTPIQMITAASAIANNQGKMMAPHILKAMIEDGEQYSNPPQVIGTPITEGTARQLTEMLAISLEEEASNALVEGYRVAGKTGTAEIPGPDGYYSNLTNASFVGWGPVDDPRFIVYVWLEKPTSDIWGSIVAAPVFSEVTQKLVILLDLPPDAVRQELARQSAPHADVQEP
jgi:cell division protein FtsI/penicillin-binding protein 2